MNDEPGRILIVEARFYEDIADALSAGATERLETEGYAWERLAVPGVFEIPAAMEMSKRATDQDPRHPGYRGYVSLGCVIRGETDHYEHICRESSRALMDFAIRHAAPHGFGILTCENRDQAWARADTALGNQGGRAATACLKMIDIEARRPAG